MEKASGSNPRSEFQPIENQRANSLRRNPPVLGSNRGGGFRRGMGEIPTMPLEAYFSIHSTGDYLHDESAVGLVAHPCFTYSIVGHQEMAEM